MSIDRRPSGQWRARWREYPGGPQKSQTFARKLDAQRFLITVENAKLTGSYVDPAKGKVTLASYAEMWLERMRPTWRISTSTLIEGSVRNHVLPKLGSRPLGALRRADIEAWAAALPLAPTTVATVRQHLGQVLTAAVDDGLIPRNPALGAKLPRVEDSRARPLDQAAVAAIVAASPAWFAVAVPLGIGLGLRQGEACGLTVDRVDFLRRTVRIDRQRVTSPAGMSTLEAPKTLSSFRTIPLPSFVANALAAHIAEHGVGDHGVLLHDDAGRLLARNRFGDVWRSVRTGTEHYHDLRHTFASTLLSSGVSVKAVADWLGHASPTVTLNTYAHLMPVDEDRARTVLDGAFAAAESRLSPTADG